MPEDTFKELHELRERVAKIHEYIDFIMDRISKTKGDDKVFLRTLNNIEYYIREIKKLSTPQGVEQH